VKGRNKMDWKMKIEQLCLKFRVWWDSASYRSKTETRERKDERIGKIKEYIYIKRRERIWYERNWNKHYKAGG
jgi:hypothetical protein